MLDNKSTNNTPSDIGSNNFLDIVVNGFYDAFLKIKYQWYFDVLGYSKDKYLSDVADPVYDGLRDRGLLDSINNKKSIISITANSDVPGITGKSYANDFNSYNPFKNGNLSLNGNIVSSKLPIGNSTNTSDLLGGGKVASSSTETKDSILLQTFGYLGLDNKRDSDGDGIPDIIDSKPKDVANLSAADMNTLFSADYGWDDKTRMYFGMSPKDTDGDGLPDVYEVKIGTSPLISDTDIDGISDYTEIIGGTDPTNADTDGDGVMDGRDMDPLNKFITVRSGVDDTDGDGVADIIEKYIGGDINNPDTDGDGVPDGMDFVINGDNDNVVKYTKGYDISTLKFNNNDWFVQHFKIENGLLSFASDIVSMFLIFAIIFLATAFTKWLYAFVAAVKHYEHTFNDRTEHTSHSHHTDHKAVANTHTNHKVATSHEVNSNNSRFATPVEKSEDEDFLAGIAIQSENEKIKEAINESNHERGIWTDRWHVVEGYMRDEMEVMWRLGIIEADNLLYDVLKEKGYDGNSLGDMMKEAKFNSISQAWDAHKVRNRIAHEGSAYHLTDREARRVFGLYEEVLRELKAI